MTTSPLSTTFEDHVSLMSHEDPQALILGWWCRLERALRYYYVAYFGEHPPSAFVAIELVANDVRIAPSTIDAVHRLRIKRNRLTHGQIHVSSPEEAAEYAAEANALIWQIGNCVPDDLALSSGAARVA